MALRCQPSLVDTGRELNVHKTLRRRPGHLLNILCTFNLRPMSTGSSCLSLEINYTDTNHGRET